MRRTGRAGLVGVLLTFLQSPQGRRSVAAARRRYDTPANRARLRQGLSDLRTRRPR